MKRPQSLESFAAKLGALDRKLSDPRDFFAGKVEEYHALATTIARSTLAALRPPDHDAAEWHRESAALVASISAELLMPAGLELHIGSAQRTLPEVSASDGVVYDLDEIRKWVLAGMRGELGAKRIDEDDEEIIRKYGEQTGSRIIAARVRRAYYSGNRDASYERLREALRQYLGASDADRSDETLDAIVGAWKQAFVPKAQRDLVDWMAEQAERIL